MAISDVRHDVTRADQQFELNNSINVEQRVLMRTISQREAKQRDIDSYGRSQVTYSRGAVTASLLRDG